MCKNCKHPPYGYMSTCAEYLFYLLNISQALRITESRLLSKTFFFKTYLTSAYKANMNTTVCTNKGRDHQQHHRNNNFIVLSHLGLD